MSDDYPFPPDHKLGITVSRWSNLERDFKLLRLAPDATYATWTAPANHIGPSGTRQVPMLWNNEAQRLATFRANVPSDYDGPAIFYNEPDLEGQANQPPLEVAAAFASIVQEYPAIQWVAPNVSQNDTSNGNPWLDAFLAEIVRLGIGDSIAFAGMHWYDYDPQKRDAIWALNAQGAVWVRHGLFKNVWFTELGCHPSWNGGGYEHVTGYDPPGVRRLEDWIRALLASPYVEQILVFSNRHKAPAPGQQDKRWSDLVYDDTGGLTALGYAVKAF